MVMNGFPYVQRSFKCHGVTIIYLYKVGCRQGVNFSSLLHPSPSCVLHHKHSFIVHFDLTSWKKTAQSTAIETIFGFYAAVKNKKLTLSAKWIEIT